MAVSISNSNYQSRKIPHEIYGKYRLHLNSIYPFYEANVIALIDQNCYGKERISYGRLIIKKEIKKATRKNHCKLSTVFMPTLLCFYVLLFSDELKYLTPGKISVFFVTQIPKPYMNYTILTNENLLLY